MGKINKSAVNSKIEAKLRDNFWKAISLTRTPAGASDFWGKFLTSSEIVILAKRLEVFKMVIEKTPYERIQDRLKVGTSTIARAQNTLRKYGNPFVKRTLKFTSS